MLHENLSILENGHLAFSGYDTVLLAEEYGTPLYLLDEEMIRKNCRMYSEGMAHAFGGGARPLYASKALSFCGIYRLMKEENMGVDVVSEGELFTALRAGFPAEQIYFHGSSKTDAEIRYGVDSQIGYFVVDNREELREIGAYAASQGIRQKVLLRLTPGIDPHTFEAVNTGKINSQFGVPIETGQAEEMVGEALSTAGVELIGFHDHIGSQIFDWTPFRDAAEIMLGFIAAIKRKYGFEARVLNLGGGFGVRYVSSDPMIDVPEILQKLGSYMNNRCAELGIALPQVLMEPGRSIVAAAGLTLYRVGSVKTVEGYKNFVMVDGGMTDNPRYALYKAPYTVLNAERPGETPDYLCTVAGRCCESGDRIQEDVRLCRPERGELLATLVTGAYNYSMASNYNRVRRLPIVMLGEHGARLAVRRESFDDLVACDL